MDAVMVFLELVYRKGNFFSKRVTRKGTDRPTSLCVEYEEA